MEAKLKVHSGDSCLCDVGIPVGHKDEYGVDLHTGDIVLIHHGSWIDTDCESWSQTGVLTSVVMDQYQSYTNGAVELKNGPPAPFVMGIRNCGFSHPEWRIEIVKKFHEVVPGEHWKGYGFGYRYNEAADAALAAAGEQS